MTRRLRVGIACRADARSHYFDRSQLDRLASFADIAEEEFDSPGETWGQMPVIAELERRLAIFASDKDVLIVAHGAPRVTARVLRAAPLLRMVGDIEGDRLAGRIDVAAVRAAGVVAVDTTHASSWPVAEWALALMLLGLRDQGRFRDVVAGLDFMGSGRDSRLTRELTGKRVGLVGFGHIAWRLRELLLPFECPILAHDPFAPRELADALGVGFAPLDAVMQQNVVVCLAPATPATAGMIGRAELKLLGADAVFVNVSRGTVVQQDALIARAAEGDAWFGLDAHDPEPLAVDSPLRRMRNVFLSPHIAGVTVEAQGRFFALMVDEVERLSAGLEPRAQLTDRVVAGRGVPFETRSPGAL